LQNNVLNGDDDDDNNDDDDDSAYDSDQDNNNRGGNGGTMPPPMRQTNPKKRPSLGHGSQSKKAKPERDGQQTRLSFTRGQSYPPMSGGLGSRSNRSCSVLSDLLNGLDDANGDETYDPSPPDGVENTGNTINGNDLDNVGSPSDVHRQCNSREGSFPLFNEWNPNGNSGGDAGRYQDSIRDDVEDIRRQEEINGDLDEEEAFQRAVRESVEPSCGH
jgi:hypothetical protein